MEIRVFIRMKTGEVREYRNIVWAKENDHGVEMADFLGVHETIPMDQIKTVKIISL